MLKLVDFTKNWATHSYKDRVGGKKTQVQPLNMVIYMVKTCGDNHWTSGFNMCSPWEWNSSNTPGTSTYNATSLEVWKFQLCKHITHQLSWKNLGSSPVPPMKQTPAPNPEYYRGVILFGDEITCQKRCVPSLTCWKYPPVIQHSYGKLHNCGWFTY